MEDMKQPESSLPDRSQMLDSKGRYLTQSLFLEIDYSSVDAIYTFKERDHLYNGKIYISPKQRYLEMQDLTEYEFANTYFAGWAHWQKICNNKALRTHVDEWRAELEYKMRSLAVKSMIKQAKTGSFQASKWLADRGWEVRGAGRPSKEEVKQELAFIAKAEDEFTADIKRLRNG